MVQGEHSRLNRDAIVPGCGLFAHVRSLLQGKVAKAFRRERDEDSAVPSGRRVDAARPIKVAAGLVPALSGRSLPDTTDAVYHGDNEYSAAGSWQLHLHCRTGVARGRVRSASRISTRKWTGQNSSIP